MPVLVRKKLTGIRCVQNLKRAAALTLIMTLTFHSKTNKLHSHVTSNNIQSSNERHDFFYHAGRPWYDDVNIPIVERLFHFLPCVLFQFIFFQTQRVGWYSLFLYFCLFGMQNVV